MSALLSVLMLLLPRPPQMHVQDLAGVGKDNDDKVKPYGPQHNNNDKSRQAAGVKHHVAQLCRPSRYRHRTVISSTAVILHRHNPGCVSRGLNFRPACVDQRIGEARRVGDCLAARYLVAVAVVDKHDKPADGKGGRVGDVDERVERVKVCEREALQRRLEPDVRREIDGQGEGEDGVEVHRQLQRGEVEAGEEGEQAVEAGDLVDDEGEEDEFGADAEGDEEEEAL